MNNNELILNMYYLGKSDTQIAKEIGYKSGESIRQWRLKNNLPSNGRNSLKVFNREIADELYFKGYTYTEIADMLKVSKNTIYVYFWKKNGKLPSEKRQSLKIELTQEQKEILFGGLLGDCHLRKDEKAVNVRGKIEHSIDQIEYLTYKWKKLSNISNYIKIIDRFDERFKNPIYTTSYFELKTNPALNDFYNNFYPDKKKVIPDDLSLLTPLAIAIWFMDDGSRTSSGYILATNSFSKEDLQKIHNYIKHVYNIDMIITNSNTLYIPKYEREKFKILIQNYIIETMKYKLIQ